MFIKQADNKVSNLSQSLIDYWNDKNDSIELQVDYDDISKFEEYLSDAIINWISNTRHEILLLINNSLGSERKFSRLTKRLCLRYYKIITNI